MKITRHGIGVGMMVAAAWFLGATAHWLSDRRAKASAFELGQATAYCEVFRDNLERIEHRTAAEDDTLALCQRLEDRRP